MTTLSITNKESIFPSSGAFFISPYGHYEIKILFYVALEYLMIYGYRHN